MPVFNQQRDINEVKKNFEFIKKLWDGENGKALRDHLFAQSTKEELAAVLREHGFQFPTGMQFVLVDVAGGRTKSLPAEIVENQSWYVLVFAPEPLRSKDKQYCEQMAWTEATFHASNDGYGM